MTEINRLETQLVVTKDDLGPALQRTRTGFTQTTAASAQFSAALTRDSAAASTALARAAAQAADAQVREANRAADGMNKAAHAAWDGRLKVAQQAAAQEERLAQQVAQTWQQESQRMQVIVGASFLAAGAAIGAGLLAAGNAAADFEKQMSAVKAVLSPEEIARSGPALEALALQLGKSGLGFSATEAAQGLEALSKAGVSVEDQMTGAGATLQLAAAGGIKVGEAAEFAANTMSVFNLKGTDMTHVADLMAGAANATTADIGDLRLAMQQFGAVANLTGQTVDSATTAIALMAAAGIKGSDAGTSLKTMFLNLQPATKEATAEMQRLGLITAEGTNLFINEAGAFRQAGEVADILNQKLGGLTAAQQTASLQTIFGTDALRAAAVMTKAGAEGWAKLSGEMGKVTAAQVAAERLNNLRGDLTNLDNAVNATAISFAKNLGPSMRPAVQAATELATALGGLPPQAMQTVGALTAVTSATLIATGAWLGLNAAAAAFHVKVPALLASTLALAAPVAAIGLAVAALSVAWIHDFAGIRTSTEQAATAIAPALSATRDSISTTAEWMHTVALPRFVDFWKQALNPVAAGASSLGLSNPLDELGESIDAGGVRLLVRIGWLAANVRGKMQSDLVPALYPDMEDARATRMADQAQAAMDTVVSRVLISVENGATEIGAMVRHLWDAMAAEGLSAEEIGAQWNGRVTQLAARVSDYRAVFIAAGQEAAGGIAEGMTAGLAPLDATFQALSAKGQTAAAALQLVGTAADAAPLLAYAEAAKTIDQAVSTLTNQSLVAEIIALRNAGETTQAYALAAGHLQAQLEGQAAASVTVKTATDAQTEATKLATQATKDATKAAADAAALAIAPLTAQLSTLWGTITSGLPVWKQLELAAAGAGKSIEEKVKLAFEAAGRSGDDFLRAIYGTAQEAQTAGAAVGAALMGGVEAGIERQQGPAVTRFAVIMREIVDSGRDAIKARSPSQLTADLIGRPMIEGVQAGWQSGVGSLTAMIASDLQAAVAAGQKAATPVDWLSDERWRVRGGGNPSEESYRRAEQNRYEVLTGTAPDALDYARRRLLETDPVAMASAQMNGANAWMPGSAPWLSPEYLRSTGIGDSEIREILKLQMSGPGRVGTGGDARVAPGGGTGPSPSGVGAGPAPGVYANFTAGTGGAGRRVEQAIGSAGSLVSVESLQREAQHVAEAATANWQAVATQAKALSGGVSLAALAWSNIGIQAQDTAAVYSAYTAQITAGLGSIVNGMGVGSGSVSGPQAVVAATGVGGAGRLSMSNDQNAAEVLRQQVLQQLYDSFGGAVPADFYAVLEERLAADETYTRLMRPSTATQEALQQAGADLTSSTEDLELAQKSWRGVVQDLRGQSHGLSSETAAATDILSQLSAAEANLAAVTNQLAAARASGTPTATTPTAPTPTRPGVLPPWIKGVDFLPPGFAAGGIAWSPQVAAVAERGPEVIQGLQSYIRDMSGTAAGPAMVNFNVTITTTGGSQTTTQDANQLLRKLREEARRQGYDLARLVRV